MRDFTHPEAGVVARPSSLRAGAKTRFVILLFFMVCPVGGVRHDLTDQIAVVRVRVRLVVRRVV